MPTPAAAALVPLYLGGVAITVTITFPTSGGTVTSAEFNVTWTISAGTQSTYRVLLWADVAETILVYDSGEQASANLFHLIPAGTLDTGMTYYVRVIAVNTGLQMGQSDLIDFMTDFQADNLVPNFRLTTFGGCGRDPRVLPRNLLRWDQAVMGAAESFIEYFVRRRIAGETVWTTIETITNIATLQHLDSETEPGTTYQYSVVYHATESGSDVISAAQSPIPQATLETDFNWLHLVGTPGTFVRFDALEVTEELGKDVQRVQYWGRRRATALVSLAEPRTMRLRGRNRLAGTREYRDQLEAMLRAQETAAAALYLRLGQQRKAYYVALPAFSIQGAGAGAVYSFSAFETYRSC